MECTARKGSHGQWRARVWGVGYGMERHGSRGPEGPGQDGIRRAGAWQVGPGMVRFGWARNGWVWQSRLGSEAKVRVWLGSPGREWVGKEVNGMAVAAAKS